MPGLSGRVSALDVEGVTASPAGAVYAVPYVQTYGDTPSTWLAVLRAKDVTDLHLLAEVDPSALIAGAATAEAARDAADAASEDAQTAQAAALPAGTSLPYGAGAGHVEVGDLLVVPGVAT